MPAPLSVVIPTLNAADPLQHCLASLVEGLAEGLLREVVVSDGGSSDATVEIAESAGARVIAGPPGRGGQLCRGMAEARGAWALVLHADSQLPPGWTEAVARHMEQSPEKAGYFNLSFRSKHPLAGAIATWANTRSRLFQMPYGDQGLLIARATYDAAGGYADVPLMEDVLLAKALRGRLSPLGATLTTGAGRYEADGWLARGLRNAGLRWRHRLGATPEDLARRYSSN